MSPSTVLRADLAFTMDHELDVITDPIVVVEDGRITAVRTAEDDADVPPDADVHDLRGHWLLPGFVNAHNHTPMALLRGFADDLPLQTWLEERIWPVEKHLDDDVVYAGALLAAAEMLAGGVTTWADMYFHMDAVAEAVVESGGRARLAPGILAPLGPVTPQIDAAVDFAHRWHRSHGDRLRVDFGPHAPDTVPAVGIRELTQAAQDLGVGVQIHVAETRGELDRAIATWGCSPVAHLADLGALGPHCTIAHAVWIDDEDIRTLADSGTRVVHNARSNMRLASGIAPVADLLVSGVTVGLGTDGAASTSQLTLLEELRSALMLAKVATADATTLDARTALHLATIGGAKALRWDDEIGSLTPGKRADVIALSTERLGLQPVHDPWSTLAHAMQDRDIARVYVSGRLVAVDGVPTGIDLEQLRSMVTAATRRLLDRS